MNIERIEGNDIEYLINYDKKVVVCKLYNCNTIFWDRVAKYCGDLIDPEYVIWSRKGHKYAVDELFVGKAKCDDEDEFDKETGMRIARIRAKKKRSKAVNNALAEFISDLQRDLANLVNYGIHKLPEDEV